MMSQLQVTPERRPVTVAVMAVGAIMRGSGVGMPSSRGEHVSLYPAAIVPYSLGGENAVLSQLFER